MSRAPFVLEKAVTAFSRTQMRTQAAVASGYHASEIVALPTPARKGPIVVDADEHPRLDTTLETLTKLPTLLRRAAR